MDAYMSKKACASCTVMVPVQTGSSPARSGGRKEGLLEGVPLGESL